MASNYTLVVVVGIQYQVVEQSLDSSKELQASKMVLLQWNLVADFGILDCILHYWVVVGNRASQVVGIADEVGVAS